MTHKDITISILIPVYNVEDYVEECVDSILAQIDNRADIILMNDASTDNSAELIKRYQQHSQVQVLDAPHNRGLSATRNAMFKLANSEYIWFIDSDDVMYDGAYKSVMSHIEALGTDIICADYVSLRQDKEVYKKAFIGAPNKAYMNINNSFIDNIIKNNSNHVWNKLFRRSVIEGITFKEGINFEDIYYMTDVSAKKFTYSYLKEPIIKYRVREGSIVKSLNQKYVDDYLEAFIYRIAEYQRLDQEEDSYGYLLYKVYKRYAGLISKIAKHKQRELLAYTQNKYDNYFCEIYDLACHRLPFHKKLILKLKRDKTKAFFKKMEV